MEQAKILLLATLLSCASQAGWHPLKTLEHYGPNAFTLKKGVAYVELRKFSTMTLYSGKSHRTTKKASSALRLYRTAPHDKEIFRRLPIQKRYAFNKGSTGGYLSASEWYYNGFMMDSAHKLWRLEYAKDVIDVLRPIDTPAEIRLVLWLNGRYSSNDRYNAKYRKDGISYLVREHFIINDADTWQGCGDYTYQYRINSSGKILQKKLIRKKAVRECGAA